MTNDPPNGPNSGEPAGTERFKVQDKRVKVDEEPQGSGSASEAPADAGASQQAGEHRQTELQQALQLAEERLDQLKRLKADFENFRQRLIREQTDVVERASRKVVEQLLPVVDDFERALTAGRDTVDEGFIRGMELVLTKIRDVLVAEGLEPIDAEGSAFDPYEHEAMSSQPGDVEEPTVLEVVRPGYRLKGKMIRPALVRVSTPAPAPDDDASGEGGG